MENHFSLCKENRNLGYEKYIFITVIVYVTDYLYNSGFL